MVTKLQDHKNKITDAKKFWDVKRAGERLLWRFGLDKPFKPNADDELALRSVLSWVNRASSDAVSNNQLFAKLYIYQLNQAIRYHQTTVFEELVQLELSKVLDTPLHLFYDAFIADLYGNQLNRISEVSSQKEKLDVVKYAQRFKETYSKDFVTSKLDEMIVNALNRFS